MFKVDTVCLRVYTKCYFSVNQDSDFLHCRHYRSLISQIFNQAVSFQNALKNRRVTAIDLSSSYIIALSNVGL